MVGTVVSPAASQHQGPGFDARLGSLEFAHSAWVSSRCSGFLPQCKGVRVRLIGHAKNDPSVSGVGRVNMSGYGNRAWGGLWPGQTQWTV